VRAHLRSNAVAYAALFLALTGTAVALPGQNTVFSDDIVDGEVKSQDIGQGQVKAEDIDPIAFATVDFKAPAGLANFFQIRDNAIQGSEIQNGQVAGADVAGNSLQRVDLAAEALGPAGLTFSDDDTGEICNELCTEGTLGSIPAGSYAVFGRIQVHRLINGASLMHVNCQLSSTGNVFDEATARLADDAAYEDMVVPLQLQGVRTFEETGDVSIDCEDQNEGSVFGSQLKITVIKLGSLN
jgi:hypothetical protein